MGVGGQRHAPTALPPGMTRYPLWSVRVLKISPPPGCDPGTVQLVASRYTDYAIPAHVSVLVIPEFPLQFLLKLVAKFRYSVRHD
jgi:hypothetical protein